MKRNAECVVRAIEHFNFRTHACIVFELLHCNLYEWMVDQRFTAPQARVCKTVAKQLARALSFLKSLGIIHCDVKPENILLERRSETVSVNPLSKVSSYPSTARAGFPFFDSKIRRRNGNNIRVKLIDFGSSCFAHVPRIYPYVQSRFYRAPEVMLRDREYDQSIDMWSFAVRFSRTQTRFADLAGTDEAEQLELAKETLGAPSSAFLNKLRREEESRKTSSDSDFDDELTKNSMKKHDSHASGALAFAGVVPTTPMKTKRALKAADFSPIARTIPSKPMSSTAKKMKTNIIINTETKTKTTSKQPPQKQPPRRRRPRGRRLYSYPSKPRAKKPRVVNSPPKASKKRSGEGAR